MSIHQYSYFDIKKKNVFATAVSPYTFYHLLSMKAALFEYCDFEYYVSARSFWNY